MSARKHMPIVGIFTLKVQDLDRERERKIEGFNQGCRAEWQRRTESGEAPTVQNMQHMGDTTLDAIWVNQRIEHYTCVI